MARARLEAAASGLAGKELAKHDRKLRIAAGKDRARQCAPCLRPLRPCCDVPPTQAFVLALRPILLCSCQPPVELLVLNVLSTSCRKLGGGPTSTCSVDPVPECPSV